MKKAVRYYSRLGSTKAIAEAIAEAIAQGAGVQAVSVTEEPELSEPVDVLFLGGAPYANLMAPELKAYADRLKPEMAGRVVLFTTSNWSRRTVTALKRLLREKGIAVDDAYFYAHSLRIQARTEAAREFGNKA